ncbi:MAG TPA: acylphosphatase [Candidatus Paceibacterota bacterium]|nr:acylphosphatase [Candidatus Paceibacterota bacterium]
MVLDIDIEVEIILTGKVQGVYLRDYLKKRADELGVRGVARNEDDGSVSVIAQGTREALEEFLRRAKRGSVFSKVEDAEVTWYDSVGDPHIEFSIE